MLNLSSFKEWLNLSEAIVWIETMLFSEKSFDAAVDSNNKYLNQAFGVIGPWYQTIVGQVNKFARGVNSEPIANDVVNDIIMSLNNPNDNFAKAIDEIKKIEDVDRKTQELKKLFATTAYLRARKFAVPYKKGINKMMVSMDDAENDVENPYNLVDRSSPINLEKQLSSLENRIKTELESMIDNNTNMASKRRLQKAIEILPLRLDGTSTEEIRQKFKQEDGSPMAKGSFSAIIDDIALAYQNVLHKIGHDAGVNYIKNKLSKTA